MGTHIHIAGLKLGNASTLCHIRHYNSELRCMKWMTHVTCLVESVVAWKTYQAQSSVSSHHRFLLFSFSSFRIPPFAISRNDGMTRWRLVEGKVSKRPPAVFADLHRRWKDWDLKTRWYLPSRKIGMSEFQKAHRELNVWTPMRGQSLCCSPSELRVQGEVTEKGRDGNWIVRIEDVTSRTYRRHIVGKVN